MIIRSPGRRRATHLAPDPLLLAIIAIHALAPHDGGALRHLAIDLLLDPPDLSLPLSAPLAVAQDHQRRQAAHEQQHDDDDDEHDDAVRRARRRVLGRAGPALFERAPQVVDYGLIFLLGRRRRDGVA